MKWVYRNDGSPLNDKNEILHALLLNRGIETVEDAKMFLYDDAFQDPFTFPQMQKAIDRILKAKRNNEKVVIHGDYDVDGISSSSMLYLYLTNSVGIKDIDVIIPHRVNDGYGLSKKSIDECATQKVTLLITVDCGIKDARLVDYAKEVGIDMIITDHHTPDSILPTPIALIHPMDYPFASLCGAGVVFKLIQALDISIGKNDAINYVDLAALGTVCDIMQLKGENRVIVKKGIEALRANNRIGLEALFELSTLTPSQIEAYHIGYVIGPKLNAAGRLGSAYDSFKLLTSNEKIEAAIYAKKLIEINKKRQEETEKALEFAMKTIEESDINVVYIPGIPLGVVGLVAGKLTEVTGRPSIVVTDEQEDSLIGGSCRSIDEVNIVEVLDAAHEFLFSHGGHAKAAGLKIYKEKYDEFKIFVKKYVKDMLNGITLQKSLFIDFPIDLTSIRLQDLYKITSMLEPFGEENPRPVFSSKIVVTQKLLMGENGKHLKLFVAPIDDKYIKFEVVGFNMGDRKVSLGDAIEIVYHVSKNEWQGRTTYQLQLIDYT